MSRILRIRCASALYGEWVSAKERRQCERTATTLRDGYAVCTTHAEGIRLRPHPLAVRIADGLKEEDLEHLFLERSDRRRREATG